ncbi:peroxiredoxin [Alistipes sp. An54]|uniref:TlpA family protein disulfide reductase n=1 Tax=Alistipes sp. An54 TaxID=1965645 RepID=UPI000B37D1D1|nr:TlpA disulfide reductase family protein [Alistipes sp. An54]OUN77979.1 peroxiredoxin [Alistipes sp. An54]
MAIRKHHRKNSRRLWIMLALIAVIAAVIVLLPTGAVPEPQPADELEATTLVHAGEEAPDFSVGMFDGSTVTLSELRGKVVLLNFWATWCPPCREELTRVQSDIIDRFAGRDFLFLPVSRGESRQAVAAFRQKTGYDFPMGLDSTRSVYDRYASNYIPRNFLIDAEGKVVTATIGFEPEEFDELIRAIEATLAQAEQNRTEE